MAAMGDGKPTLAGWREARYRCYGEEQQEEGPMTRSLFLLPVTALLLSACQAGETTANDAAEENSTTAVDISADEKAIRGHVDRWLQLAKAKDAAGIAELYAEDGAVMPPNASIGKGRAAIEQTWASMMRTPGFDLTFAPEQIVVSSSGDMALDRGTYSLTIAPDGTTQTDTGKYVVVWRKIGGEWKASADIFNSDLPASGG
jgi:uncharacterized protein (TIGR02246 family)